MRNNFTLIIILLLSIIMGGCTQYRYEYIPPTSYEGQECTMRCGDRKWDCNDRCECNYSECKKNDINKILLNTLAQTTIAVVSKQNVWQGNGMTNDECKSNKNSCNKTCDNMYNDCYQSCGGQVIVHEAK